MPSGTWASTWGRRHDLVGVDGQGRMLVLSAVEPMTADETAVVVGNQVSVSAVTGKRPEHCPVECDTYWCWYKSLCREEGKRES